MSILIPVLLFTFIVVLLLILVLVFSRLLLPKGPLSLIINDKEPFTVSPGETLLNALYAKEIYIPSACGGKGTCGYCKVRVLSGDTNPLPTEMEFLTRSERETGFRLACQIKLMESCQIRVPPEYLDAREYHGVVSSTRVLTPSIREICISLSPDESMEFACGQYVQVRIPHEESPEGYVFRAYSIASEDTTATGITLTVKRIENGIGSTWLHALREGDALSFTGPYGDWALQTDKHLVLIGGGVGMAPMRSIILSLIHRHPEQKISLYFGARTTSELLYHDFFRSLDDSHEHFT
ncbi:2Fe-2S iron-sulfur cluster binding domain-containing protein, partial [Myxococcota bacterium]|nr:2Fe-2S iron-sulfur cluster binding domain-containing protein [Myxococcota bacterium]